MNKLHWAKPYFLGMLLLLILLLIPVGISQAQGNTGIIGNDLLGSSGGDNQIDQQPPTDTPTATPTETPTDTPTSTATATETSTSTSTATATETATNTPSPTSTSTSESTSTSTATLTPTSTSTGNTPTATATSTSTATPPTYTATSTATRTPTPTGSVTPVGIPTLRVSVTPTQAKVNENFTFTIDAGNNGTIATTNNMVLDSFPTYIDVLTVTANRGSITKLSHSFVVTIGDIQPAERVTIIAVVRVNSTLSRTESVANTVTLTYGVSKSITTSVNYRVLYTTLPPTGELPLNWRDSQVKTGGVVPAMLIMVLGVVLLLLGVWSKINQQKNTLWMIAGGTILVLAGFFIGTSALGLIPSVNGGSNGEILPTDASLALEQPENQTGENLAHLPAYSFSTPEAIVPFATLPDYPIPTPVITQTPGAGSLGPDTSAIERIAIPAIFLDTVVKYVPYDGFSWMINGLREEVAWMGNTSWPGLGGNTALAGHVTVAGLGDGPFRHLEEVPTGEVVILYTENNIYTYKVRETRITDDGDMSVISPTNDAQISLITCTNWDDQSKSYLNRLVLIADLVRTEPITAGFVP